MSKTSSCLLKSYRLKDEYIGMLQRLKRRARFFQSYCKSPLWDTHVSPPELFNFLMNHPAGKALDIGCGTGTNLITMAEKGWVVDGVEFIGKAVRAARRKIYGKNLPIHIYHTDFLTRTFPAASYDLILDMGCYHSLPDEDKRLYEEKVTKSLVHGGYYLLYGFLQTTAPRQAITSNDLQILSTHLKLIRDERSLGVGDRPAAWLLFQRD